MSQPPPAYTCPRCNAPIYAGQPACSNCGLALDAASLAAFQTQRAGYPPPGPVQVAPTAPAPAPRRPVWMWALGGLIGLLALCAVFAALAPKTPTTAVATVSVNATSTTASGAAATAPPAAKPTTAPATKAAAVPAATDTSAPPPATKTSAPPPPTAVPPTVPAAAGKADVAVLDFVDYTDAIDDLNVIGFVQNKGQSIASSVEVAGEAIDANGDTVASGRDIYLTLIYLEPGAKAPFKISLGKPTGKTDKVHVTGQFDTYDPAGFNIFKPVSGLTIEGQKFAAATNSYTPAKVTGRVKNGSAVEAAGVRVLAAGYDAKGQLVAVDSGSPELDTMPAGGTAAFTVQFYSRLDVKIVKADLYPFAYEK